MSWRRSRYSRGFPKRQVGLVLGPCASRFYSVGERVCDAPGDGLCVLIWGELSIFAHDHQLVTRVRPGGAVGEIGVVTGQRIVATIEASKPSKALVLSAARLDDLLAKEPELRARINENALRRLKERLLEEDIQLRDFCWGDTGQVEHEDKGQVEALELRSDTAGDSIEPSSCRQILVVDDEPIICRVIAKGLASYSVTNASDGRAALKAIEETPPDLVITDIRMPNLDGVDLLINLRSRYPQIPVLAISGYLQAGELEGLEFDGFLEKPVNLRDLRIKVDQVLATHGRSG